MTATRTTDQGQTVTAVPGQPGTVTTGPVQHWSSYSGLPDPITRPADPFAGIPGAYDEPDDWGDVGARAQADARVTEESSHDTQEPLDDSVPAPSVPDFARYGLRAMEDSLDNVGRRCCLLGDNDDRRWEVLVAARPIVGGYRDTYYLVSHLDTGEWRLMPLAELGNLY